MEYNISKKVKSLCKQKGIQLKDLSARMGIAPESLSRAINRNPQLSTIASIAENLGVSVGDLFIEGNTIPLTAIIVHEGKTYLANDLKTLKTHIAEIEMTTGNTNK